MFETIVQCIFLIVALVALYGFAIYGAVKFIREQEQKRTQKNKEVKQNDEDHIQ